MIRTRLSHKTLKEKLLRSEFSFLSIRSFEVPSCPWFYHFPRVFFYICININCEEGIGSLISLISLSMPVRFRPSQQIVVQGMNAAPCGVYIKQGNALYQKAAVPAPCPALLKIKPSKRFSISNVLHHHSTSDRSMCGFSDSKFLVFLVWQDYAKVLNGQGSRYLHYCWSSRQLALHRFPENFACPFNYFVRHKKIPGKVSVPRDQK